MRESLEVDLEQPVTEAPDLEALDLALDRLEAEDPLKAALVNLPYLACIVVTIVLTSVYSLPPPRTKRIPFLANATIATPRGLLMVLAGWAAGNGFARPEAWILGTLAWFYIFGAATTKDFADTDGDRATGCITLPILWGPRAAARFVAPFLVLPFVCYVPAAALGWLTLP